MLDQLTPIITILLHASILIALIVIILVLLLRKNVSPIEDFKTSLDSLNTILTVYKNNILIPKIEKLKKEHDLNPESQSNSIVLFNQQKEELIQAAVQETFSKFLDKRLVSKLEQYHTRDSLILFIVTYFRG
ncbi:MAG: hypothetical protein R3250_01970 [Melioribacteraceae bacterium]|nr:hypothetical protein [Melioribacteraceae bacterium]